MAVPIILCVDDDVTVLKALRTLLGSTLGSGVEVEVAESGAEALEFCHEMHTQGREIGLVISDFIMPVMRGDELLVRLHEKFPAIVKIMLTGQSDLGGVRRTINEANLYRFLEKPFNNADMVLTAKSALEAFGRDARQRAEIAVLQEKIAALQQALAAAEAKVG